MHRDASLHLLESLHVFPSEHQFQVIVRAADPDRFEAAVIERFSVEAGERFKRVASRNGTYVSLRVTLPVASAEAVLDVYAFFRELDYLVTVM